MKNQKSNVLNAAVNLHLDWCSYKAAKYAIEHWHYSSVMPAGKSIKIGVWENGEFIGCVVFSRGAIPEIGMPYRMSQTQICELTRVALRKHSISTTRIISVAIGLLRISSPNLRLIVSYADKNQKHYGTIYQAGNWIYVGTAHDKQGSLILNGKQFHGRSVFSKYGTRSLTKLSSRGIVASYAPTKGKYKYLYPLDSDTRKIISPLAKPYPKRAVGDTKDTLGVHPREGVSTTTTALQSR